MAQKKKIIVLGRFPPPYDGQSIQTERFASLVEDSCDVIRVNTAVPHVAPWLSKISRYFTSGSQFAEQLALHPDAIVVWQSISPQFSGHVRDRLTVLKYISDRKVIAVIHWGSFARLFASFTTRGSALNASNLVSKFVFNDPVLSGACAEWIPDDKRVVLPNSVEEALLVTDAEIGTKKSGRTGSKLRLLYLSNMIESKGYLDVVRAAGKLKERGLSFQLDLVGGWYRKKDKRAFEELARGLNLSTCVVHHGPVTDRNKIKTFHLMADVFLLPTYYPTEAQPVSIIEALSAGTPVITTAHGGIPGMVTHEIEALIVRPESPDDIANAVERLYDHKRWESMSTLCRKRFADVYHPDIIRKRWIELIDRTCAEST